MSNCFPACRVSPLAGLFARGALVGVAALLLALGPQDLSFRDMAQIMSEVLGKPVRYRQIPAQASKTG